MKTRSIISSLLFCFLLSAANAQTKSDAEFFAGNWTVLVKGTPQGDAKMVFVLSKNDAGLAGVIQDTTGVETHKINRVDLAPNKMIVFFNSNGFDVNVELNKKDDDHLVGSLLGMFDSEAERVKGR